MNTRGFRWNATAKTDTLARMIRHILILLAALVPAIAGAQDAESTATLSRIAFGSGASDNLPLSVWGTVTNAQPDLFLLIGDGSGHERPGRETSQGVLVEAFRESASFPRRTWQGFYNARVYGPPGRRVQVILLDTRTFRGPLRHRAASLPGEGPYEANPDRSSTMLGTEQWTWLRRQLRVPAELRLIVSSIQVIAEDHHWEKWMNLPHERQRLFDMISDTEADGIIFLSGDRHHAELSMMKGPQGYPLYDLTSSALNMSSEEPVVEINRHGVSDVYDGNNFGLVTVDWNLPDPAITF